MATCVVCKDELSEDAGVFVSDYYVRRHRLDVAPVARFVSTFSSNYAHSGCIEFPADLDEQAFKRWVAQSVTQQKDAINTIRRSLRRINNALLALPEDLTATFRDELEHERRTYGDGE